MSIECDIVNYEETKEYYGDEFCNLLIKIYRTDQNGSIMFKIKNNKLQIETYSP